MEALVSAGGKGTRSRPLSHTPAKQLTPVTDKPVLYYGLEAVWDASVTGVGIVVGGTVCEIREAAGDGFGVGLDMPFLAGEEPSGLARCVLTARDFSPATRSWRGAPRSCAGTGTTSHGGDG